MTPEETPPVTRVSVVDLKMPFDSMVLFMVKWAIAAIPALLLLLMLGFFASAVVAGLFSAR